MKTFYDVIQEWDWESVKELIYSRTVEDVDAAMAKDRISMEDFAALVSPAASERLEVMAAQSAAITRRRFGNTMQLYAPLYLSNYCANQCIYCGFNCKNNIHRVVLSEDDIRREAVAIRALGFQHILLVTGEAPAKAGVEYMARSIEIMKEYFAQVSLEVQPLDEPDYIYLMSKGLHSVYIYQETYNEKRYPAYHLGGKKANYRYRLETPDRLCKAGVFKVGIANLIGLEDWRTEAFFTALHLRYLEKSYWRSKFSIAFPRMRPHASPEVFQPNSHTSERDLLQLITSYRLLSEDVELSISTRESSDCRDIIMPFGVTCMSAESKTSPGGYADDKHELEQFEINDDRTASEVASVISGRGFEPVWKDWSIYLQ